MKKVAVIQDLSSFGRCSLTAAIPVLSVLGVQTSPLPTAILTAQSEYPSYYCEDLTAHMPHYIEQWQHIDAAFHGIQTGYVTGEAQLAHICSFLDAFQRDDTVLLVDPVMGDRGMLYPMLTDEMLINMRQLVRRATIITPNVTEACLLAGVSYESLHRHTEDITYMAAVTALAEQLVQLTGADVFITGVVSRTEHSISTVYAGREQSLTSTAHYNGKSYSGTGDLFASVIIGSVLQGSTIIEAMTRAERFIQAAIAATPKHDAMIAGVHFEKALHTLLSDVK